MYAFGSHEIIVRMRHQDRLREAEHARLVRLSRAAACAARTAPVPRARIEPVVVFWSAALKRYGAALGA